MDIKSDRRHCLLICLLLMLVTIGVYWQVVEFDFVNFDDIYYVVNNPNVQTGLTVESAKWAFTTVYHSNWIPLIWLSYMLDYEIGGAGPRVYHLTNLLLHLANILLLFAVINRMTKRLWPSAFVAMLFAVHPLHVESVAWIAERKDVLSTLFWILAMWLYVRYTERPGVGGYVLIVLVFILGLMSKPMLVTLPIMLLLMDYWPLQRMCGKGSFIKLVREKIPLFVLAAVGCVVTYLAQHKGGAVGSLDVYPLDVRIENALVSYIAYIKKTIWPDGLAVFYPHPGATLPVWQIIASAVILVIMSVLAGRAAHRRPYIIFGWIWYVVTLLPVIGLVQIGGQAMADRYTYIPLVGIFIIATWGFTDLLGGECERVPNNRRLAAIASLVTITLALCTYVQVGHWRNTKALFTHTIKVTGDDNAVAHANLAFSLSERGELDEAVIHYKKALKIVPRNSGTRCNLAIALIRQGKLEEGIRQCVEVLRIDPKNAEAYNDIGVALAKQGKLSAAEAHFLKALELDPSKQNAKDNLQRVRRLSQAGK